MADRWGADYFPTASYDPAYAAGDRCLTVLGQYLQAAVNSDANYVWSRISPAHRVVEHIFAHNPRHRFHEDKLPALYLFEASSRVERIGDDLYRDTREISIQWIARTTEQNKELLRSTIVNVVAKSVGRALIRQRHPAWVVTGDADPVAATRGSFLLTHANLEHCAPGTARTLEITAPAQGEQSAGREYRGFDMQITVRETLGFDAAFGVTENKAQATLQTNDDTTNTQVFYAPPGVEP